jgi:hypothetical protein
MDLDKRIDSLHDAATPPDAPALSNFYSALEQHQASASKSFARYFTTFLLFWVAIVLIARGAVTEGSVASLKLANLKLVLVVAPPVIGGLFYLMALMGGISVYMLNAVQRSYKHRLPKLYELDLEQLVVAPTFYNVERTVRYELKDGPLRLINEAWLTVLGLFIFVVPVVALIHVSHLLIGAAPVSRSLSMIAISVGCILWLRGIFVAYVIGNNM